MYQEAHRQPDIDYDQGVSNKLPYTHSIQRRHLSQVVPPKVKQGQTRVQPGTVAWSGPHRPGMRTIAGSILTSNNIR